MKKYSIVIFLFYILKANSQSPIISLQDYDALLDVPSGTYAKDLTNYYTPFLGEWKWENGNNKLEIKFEKISQVYDGDIYFDYLVGKYKYTKNGVVLHNSLDYPINNQNFGAYSYAVFNGLGFNKDEEIFCRFDDLQKKQHLNAYFTLIDPTIINTILVSNSIKLRTSLITQLNLSGSNNSLPGLNYPEEMILIKQ